MVIVCRLPKEVNDLYDGKFPLEFTIECPRVWDEYWLLCTPKNEAFPKTLFAIAMSNLEIFASLRFNFSFSLGWMNLYLKKDEFTSWVKMKTKPIKNTVHVQWFPWNLNGVTWSISTHMSQSQSSTKWTEPIVFSNDPAIVQIPGSPW